MAGVPEKMIEYLLETRVDAAKIYTISFFNNLSLSTTTTTTSTSTTTTKTMTSTTTTETTTTIPTTTETTTTIKNNYSFINNNNNNKNDLLTKNCCINFNNLPIRYMDDLDTNFNGYENDKNINYYKKLTNNNISINSSSPTTINNNHHLLTNQKDIIEKNSQLINLFVVENLDVSLEDFILTYIIFIPTNFLCNYLKIYYNKCRKISNDLSTQFNIVREKNK